MEKAPLASSRERPVTFVPNGALGLIDPDHSHTNRIATAAPELDYLIAQVIDDAVYLLDHRLRENLYLNSNLDRGDWSSRHNVPTIRDRGLAGNDFPKRPVSAPGRDTSTPVLDVQNAVLPGDDGLDQLGGPVYGDEVFVEVHRDNVTLTRITMPVDPAFK